jgi:hypothetical protein
MITANRYIFWLVPLNHKEVSQTTIDFSQSLEQDPAFSHLFFFLFPFLYFSFSLFISHLFI